ncbi:hypothetical protein B296_00049262 [Ensete ventricosum]|uniref:Uncharacterized protein n=1 Tax=Ensete ventricosum TaxID=4639 RepID=A0A426Y761_ENSVE|nr:hypothetical protein B296_00049262 [Ensete ventricosum]
MSWELHRAQSYDSKEASTASRNRNLPPSCCPPARYRGSLASWGGAISCVQLSSLAFRRYPASRKKASLRRRNTKATKGKERRRRRRRRRCLGELEGVGDGGGGQEEHVDGHERADGNGADGTGQGPPQAPESGRRRPAPLHPARFPFPFTRSGPALRASL